MKQKIISQVYNLISENSKVIDIGCGNGGLLFELSSKINSGLGIDINNQKIKSNKKEFILI
ncbi:methyltransferase domain-containing protein [Candidatus Pacearchaeota archaeon]|nr:methyltransferase domain-containing protein [Candidatus Pacearchaeota archaeon]